MNAAARVLIAVDPHGAASGAVEDPINSWSLKTCSQPKISVASGGGEMSGRIAVIVMEQHGARSNAAGTEQL
jgi:hypothetical protein